MVEPASEKLEAQEKKFGSVTIQLAFTRDFVPQPFLMGVPPVKKMKKQSM